MPNPNFGEFKKVIDQNKLNSITYTMHSWDFIKRWFFLPNRIAGNERQIKIFKKCVNYAKRKGYVFSDLRDFTLQEDADQCINLCDTLPGKIRGLWYNYLRFAENGRSFKKYALLYFFLFLPIILLIILFFLLVL